MKKIIAFLFFLTAMLVYSQVGGSAGYLMQVKPSPSVQKEDENSVWKSGKYNLEKVTTIGNHSWAPLDVSGRADDWYKSILYLLQDFEQANPGIKVTSWHLQETEGFCEACEIAHPTIEGVWIDHKPKQKK